MQMEMPRRCGPAGIPSGGVGQMDKLFPSVPQGRILMPYPSFPPTAGETQGISFGTVLVFSEIHPKISMELQTVPMSLSPYRFPKTTTVGALEMKPFDQKQNYLYGETGFICTTAKSRDINYGQGHLCCDFH